MPMSVKLETVLEGIHLTNVGRFFACVIFTTKGGEPLDNHAVSSLERKENGWELPDWQVLDSGEVVWDKDPPFAFSLCLTEPKTLVVLNFTLYQYGSSSLPGTSKDSEKGFVEIALGSLDIHPQTTLFENCQLIQNDLSTTNSYIKRLLLFNQRMSEGVQVSAGSVILKTVTSPEPKDIDDEVAKEANTGKQDARSRLQFSSPEQDLVVTESSQIGLLPGPVVQTARENVTEHQWTAESTSNLAVQNSSPLPISHSPEKEPTARVPSPVVKERIQKRDTLQAFEPETEFPPLDAVRSMLPKYHALTKCPPRTTASVEAYVPMKEPRSFHVDVKTTEASDTALQQTSQATFVTKQDNTTRASQSGRDVATPSLSLEARQSLDSHVIAVLDYQANELDRYRIAIRKMGEDIVRLRGEVTRLEVANSQLRSKVYYVDEWADELSDQKNANHTTGKDSQQIADLKKRLMIEKDCNAELRKRLEGSQNDIIMSNEKETRFLKMQQAHQSQQSLVQQLQKKLTKYKLLEKTCQDQEKVIVELEKRLTGTYGNTTNVAQNGGPKVKFTDADIGWTTKHKHLLAQNDLPYSKVEMSNAIVPNGLMVHHPDLDERIRLIEKLERAEGRIMALERQLAENTRIWAKEKSGLQFTSMHRHLEQYQSSFRQVSTPPLPAIEPSYAVEKYPQNQYPRYGRRVYSPYQYHQI